VTANVGFVGVGRMGAAMLQCVIDSGYAVTAYDVAVDAMAPFAAARPDRVRVASTPREVGSASAVIDVVVNTEAQVLDACLGDDGVVAGATAGTIVLVHSTISLDTLRRVATVASESGVRVLDAPVSGVLGHLSVGDLCVMVGGDPDAFAEAKPVLDTYGSLVVHLGPLGAGLDAKLALNLLRYLGYLAGQESARLADRAGIPAATMREIARHTGATNLVGDISKGRSPEDYERRLNNAETAQKDLDAALARAAELQLELPTTAFAVDLMHGIWAVEARTGPGPN
jgi:3-hydroxyisobutyrate dehydrogenase